MKPFEEKDTAEYQVSPTQSDVLPPKGVSSLVQVDLAALSHPGKVRPNNEDHYLVVRAERALEALLTNLPGGVIPGRFNELMYGMLVADGIGGHAAGETASLLAISTLVNLVLHEPDWIMRPGEREFEEVMRRITERYRRVDEVLRQQAKSDPNLTGMGTTLTLAGIRGRDLTLAHVGDSRAYLLRGGQFHQLTRDHTLAQGLADLGVIAQEDTATHHLRHVLTSALGVGGNRLEPQVQRLALANEDQILLCTDGLTEMVDKATIAAILCRSGSSSDACAALVEQALRNGGKDNVTVALARYRFPS